MDSSLPELSVRLRFQRIQQMRQRESRRAPLPQNLRQLGAVGHFVPTPTANSQRTVVAGTITKGTTTGAHLQYLQQGKGVQGADAVLFTAPGRVVDPQAFAQAATADPHQFRMSVSLDRDHPYFALQPYVETLMARVEHDLGRPLDWVAATHHDTAHTHTHLVLRGRDRDGQDLYITPDYLQHGLRARADQIATWVLGPRYEVAQRQTQVSQQRASQKAPAPVQGRSRGRGW